MKLAMRVAAACIASALLAGTAAASDMPSRTSLGYGTAPHYRHGGYSHRRHGASLFGFGHRSSAAGRAKQRHRTRLDRCNNAPSRC